MNCFFPNEDLSNDSLWLGQCTATESILEETRQVLEMTHATSSSSLSSNSLDTPVIYKQMRPVISKSELMMMNCVFGIASIFTVTTYNDGFWHLDIHRKRKFSSGCGRSACYICGTRSEI